MKRRPSTQDISWILDLARNKQLDLEPPYQRRSVWTTRDRQFFLDTLFRDFPSPAIFLHKDIDDQGRASYHVVDGKQRLQTILDFANDKLKVAKDFGDDRLSGKKWSEISDTDLRHTFWNYQISVELVDVIEGTVVHEVFDRLNRNSRKLTPQELRHAKFDGWLITTVEAEAVKEEWKSLSVVTTARAKRMADTQFISELLLVVLENRLAGFDQDAIDEAYAKYDEPEEVVVGFSEEKFRDNFEKIKAYLIALDRENQCVTRHAKTLTQFYTLWAVVALCDLPNRVEPSSAKVAIAYDAFMVELENVQRDKVDSATIEFYDSSRGASTDLGPRQKRFDILRQKLGA